MNSPTFKVFGALEAWMTEKQNVIRFLLVRTLLMIGMVLAFSFFYLSQS